MTVQELIARLQRLDPVLPAFVWDPPHAKDGEGYAELVVVADDNTEDGVPFVKLLAKE
jgi:hypothetical protein